jgi:hypothetical protein
MAAQNIARNIDTDITQAHAAVAHFAHHQFLWYTSLVHCTNQSILFIVNDDNA